MRSLMIAFAACLIMPISAANGATEGIDVSHHNGVVDWSKVKASGIAFAYVKASEGVDDPDAMFAQHWQALAQQKIARGAYHFFVTEDDPAEQARLFLSQFQPKAGDLRPAIDIEVLGKGSGGDAPKRLATFLSFVTKAVGARPVIYTSARFWDTEMARDPRLMEAIVGCPLWVAEYETSAPRIPKGWTQWTMWQWQSGKTLAGITGGVDRSRLHPSLKLEQILLPKAPKKR